MNDLKFNIYALVDPRTPAELAALIDEAMRVIEDLSESVSALEAALDRQATRRDAGRSA